MSKVAHGKNTPTSATDPEVVAVSQHIRELGAAARPGAYLVDSIPWLRYLPFYGLELKHIFEGNKKLTTDQLNRVKRDIVRLALPTIT